MKIVATLAVTALGLTACADTLDPPDGQAEDTVVSQRQPLTDEEIADKAFLQTVRKHDPTMRALSDDVLTGLGEQVCRDIDDVPITDPGTLAVYAMAASDEAGEDLAFVIGAAIGAYCPEDTYLTQP